MILGLVHETPQGLMFPKMRYRNTNSLMLITETLVTIAETFLLKKNSNIFISLTQCSDSINYHNCTPYTHIVHHSLYNTDRFFKPIDNLALVSSDFDNQNTDDNCGNLLIMI